jgi:hypothetical protein
METKQIFIDTLQKKYNLKMSIYTEKEVYILLEKAIKDACAYELESHYSGDYTNLKKWFEQFKNK